MKRKAKLCLIFIVVFLITFDYAKFEDTINIDGGSYEINNSMWLYKPYSMFRIHNSNNNFQDSSDTKGVNYYSTKIGKANFYIINEDNEDTTKAITINIPAKIEPILVNESN